ncbi:hypothetical protein [Psychroserpens sp. Hel_I_66]|uniref:hypothetical protein n=1 Tax=Psychroserpens sp. Hel_I_66 TaxID=1250004 RepID=UPI000645C90A|nr:hypothetical protein [Psychroserpens sp. Hel_I_66]
MKKIIKLIPILLLVVAFSCSDDDNARFANDPTTGWVEFGTSTSSTTISLQTETLTLPVSVRVPIYENGLNVSYELQPVQGDFNTIVNTGSVLNFLSSTASTVDGSSAVQNIVLEFENLDSLTEVIVFDVVITNVDVNGVDIGLDENSITTFRVSTPCPLLFSDNYNVSVSALGGTAPSHDVALVPLGGNQFSVSSTWGPNFVAWATGDPGFEGQFPYPAVITVNEDLTVDVVGTGNANLTGGTGTYDSCSDVFLITLSQGLFTTDFTVDIQMTSID